MAATTLRSSLDIDLGWTWRDQLGDFSVSDNNRLHFRQELTDGTGVHQADAVWRVSDQTLESGLATTFHLNALAESLFGNTIQIPLNTVRILMIVNKTTTGNGYLLVGGAEANEWHAPFGMPGHTVKAMPGSPLLMANLRSGWLVKPDNEALKLVAIGNDIVYDLVIVGTR
jgi:hypothetical protein